jgi:predicted GNAT superfamily acetyltransferase
VTSNSPRADDTTVVRPLESPAEYRAGVDLYRAVLRLDQTDPAVSPRLLAALRHNGGSVMGAFPEAESERLIGFAYGFLGRDATTGETYHYSQTAVVSDDWQGKGVGRALKLGQREYVLATGVERMRWTYDPVRSANAHFNLDVLGARARWFVRNFYGIDEMGRDRGHASDRLVVEWDLAGEPPPATGDFAVVPGWGEAVTVAGGNVRLIGVPRDWSDVAADHDRAVEVREAVSDVLESAIGERFVACSCRVADNQTAVYVLRKEQGD